MSELAERMNCNGKVNLGNSNVQKKDTDTKKENLRTLHEQTIAVSRVVVDDENKIIRFCKLVADRPALTFGKLPNFSLYSQIFCYFVYLLKKRLTPVF
jgi:hypothetical protein